jgi:ribosomal protein S18 acetylase RimI-like enzyme
MELLHDIKALKRYVGAVRRATPAYTSNLYAAADQLERWCVAGQLSVLIADKAVLLLRANHDFYHVYHVAEDQSSLGDALKMLADGIYVTDLIGQGEALDPICATHAASGFAAHTFLQRMTLVQAPEKPREGDVVVAKDSDAPMVAAFLERLLDRFAEQIPNTAELECEARAGHLLLVRRDNDIAGMLMYDRKGRTAQLRFWHVNDNARGEGVGRRLMSAFLARCADAQRLVLWVIGDNIRSVAIYRHYGFTSDGLLDRIMILRKERIND